MCAMSLNPRPRSKPVTRGEEIEQAKVVKWSHRRDVRDMLPDLVWLHHSPNGGKRDAFTGAQMKALGVKPGFPDLILPVCSRDHHGLVIEMKSETGRVSLEQNVWLAHFAAQKWEIGIARSAQEARTIICRYLGLPQACVPSLDE